ncbi:MAG: NUDIX domain-containing protein [Bacillota bacterium]
MKPTRREKQVSRKTVYTCDFLNVYEDDVVLPNDQPSKRVVVSHVGAASVLPITEEGNVVLVRQYRYAADYDSLEIPAGKKDHPDEDGLECAKRELAEETYLRSDDYTHLHTIYSAIGFSDEAIEIYVARNVKTVTYEVGVDPDEFIDIETLSLKDAIAMAKDGRIRDSKTVIALLMMEGAVNDG